ncbi:MAG TPA: MFS transporter [Syntrophomonadaceae bacterium]|nr:MFS transporter [Syntrophomonadaceae bacterium]
MSNNKLQTSSYSWILLAIVGLAGAISVYAQLAVAARAFEIIPALKLGAAQFALIVSAPMFPSIFLCFPVGGLADRFGVKIVVTIGMIIAIVGTAFRYLTPTFAGYFALMSLTGTGVMCINANVGKIVGAWFSQEDSGRALGIYYAVIRLGMFIGLATGAMFPTAKASYIFEGILMVAATILWMLFAKNAPEGVQVVSTEPISKHIGVAIRSKNVWLAGIGACFYWGGFMAFNGNLANGLNVMHKIDPVTAGWIASMLLLGNTFGNVLGPVWADKLGRMKPFLQLGLIGCLILLFGWNAPTMWLWPILFIGGFIFGLTLPFFMLYPVLLPDIGIDSAGSAGGLIADLMIVGAVCVPSFLIAPIVGMDFNKIFLMGTLCLLIVSILSAFLPEVGAKAMAQKAESSQTAA